MATVRGTQAVILVLGSLGSIGVFLTGVAAYLKYRPERTKITVETADVNVRIAGDLRDDAVEAWRGARAELDELKRKVRDIETSLRHEQEQRRLSNKYARTLAQVLRDHNMPVPPPPDGLDLE